jgi:Ceramidase
MAERVATTVEQRQGVGHKRRRVTVLVATALIAVGVVYAMPPIPQDPAYHHFADSRPIWGVPNGLNVLSNLAFAVVGVAGLWLLLRRRVDLGDPRERWPWIVFFVGVALTSVGSAWYHLAPGNETLVWDRMPMAVAFMGLFAAVIAERIDAQVGRQLLWPLALLGVAGVLYWYFTQRSGVGDLRPYVLVQFYPVLAIPLILLLFPRKYTLAAGFIGAWVGYALAKVAEIEDGRILGWGGLVSGHTLKHLVAAAGIGALLWMLLRRTRVAA